MPYSPSEVSRSIATEVVALTFNTPPKRYDKVGLGVYFSGKLTRDGVGYGGQTVNLRYYSVSLATWITLVYLTTGSDGAWSSTFTPDYGWGCQDVRFRAEYGSIISNEVKYAVAYPTRVTITAPASVVPGQTFTISGKLEYEKTAGSWMGLGSTAERTIPVELYRDGVLIGTATTDFDGNYVYSTSITTSAMLKAVFKGALIPTGLLFAPSIGEWTWWSPLDLVSILAPATPVIVVGTMVAWDALRHK